ncbi:MAG: 50S ribosomal protein L6 [Actinobacteria bacterium]|nr:50S ribosomal protein L6 [Actinomycetota bacterium]
MSRVGKAAITIPQGVEVTIGAESITVKGSKGTLVRPIPAGISVKKVETSLVVERAGSGRDERSRHGMLRAMIRNMVDGVTQGYARDRQEASRQPTSPPSSRAKEDPWHRTASPPCGLPQQQAPRRPTDRRRFGSHDRVGVFA